MYYTTSGKCGKIYITVLENLLFTYVTMVEKSENHDDKLYVVYYCGFFIFKFLS